MNNNKAVDGSAVYAKDTVLKLSEKISAMILVVNHIAVDGTSNRILIKELLENEESYNKMARACNPYGDGKACKRIVSALSGKMTQEFSLEY